MIPTKPTLSLENKIRAIRAHVSKLNTAIFLAKLPFAAYKSISLLSHGCHEIACQVCAIPPDSEHAIDAMHRVVRTCFNRMLFSETQHNNRLTSRFQCYSGVLTVAAHVVGLAAHAHPRDAVGGASSQPSGSHADAVARAVERAQSAALLESGLNLVHQALVLEGGAVVHGHEVAGDVLGRARCVWGGKHVRLGRDEDAVVVLARVL